MDKFVARLNVEHYRKKIAAETDEAQRQKLLGLLTEREAKLAAIEARDGASRWDLAIPANGSVSRQSASWFPR
jgi:hypothetical protein